MTKSIDVVPTWYWPDGVPRYVSPPRGTVTRATIDRWARRAPEQVAIRSPRGDVDYATAQERSQSIADTIERERRAPVPRLFMQGESSIGTVLALLGGLRAGADVVLFDPSAPAGLIEEVGNRFGIGQLLSPASDGSSVEITSIGAHPSGVADANESRTSGRLGLLWGDGLVLHGDESLLGWALAFRAFAELAKDDLFAVLRPLSEWEGLVGLFSPLVVGSTVVLPEADRLDDSLDFVEDSGATGLWVGSDQAREMLGLVGVRAHRGTWRWVYVSVDGPWSVRDRRRLGRLVAVPVLTVFGTPGTGPVAASPYSWCIDEAVGTPMTGVDLVPVDQGNRRVAEPPWPVLAYAGVGVRSTLFGTGVVLEGAAPGGFVEEEVFDTGARGRIDANGFLYLVP